MARLARRLGIPKSRAKELMRAAQFDRLEVGMPLDAEEARSWLAQLEGIASADQRLDRRERAVLDDLARRAGVAPASPGQAEIA